MKLGPRTNDGASLKLRIPTALPKDMRGKVVEVCALRTMPNKRRMGFAGDLLMAVCIEADIAKRFLFLCVDPESDCDMDKSALGNFYGRHGFIPIQADPLLMTRPYVGAMIRA